MSEAQKIRLDQRHSDNPNYSLAEVYLDGERRQHVLVADEIEGFIELLASDGGSPVREKTGKYKTKKIHGEVQIKGLSDAQRRDISGDI